jgi:hypothetical protein
VPSASVRVLLLLQLTGLISLLTKLFARISDEETDERRLNHQENKRGCFLTEQEEGNKLGVH